MTWAAGAPWVGLVYPAAVLSLRVGHLVPDTEAEGPGRRFALWVAGCPLRCPGCCNPELLAFGGGDEWPVDELAARIIATEGIEGVSVLGGEPMSQPGAVLELVTRVAAAGLSTMVYTGFTLAELRARGRRDIDALLDRIDLLVDGPYRREDPETERRWIGSRNQVMHFSSDRYSPDDPRFRASNTVEIRLDSAGLLVNGWPDAADALVRLARAVKRP